MNSGAATLRRLRTLCLSFPETSEVQSWGHPNFRAGKKTFERSYRLVALKRMTAALDAPVFS